MGKFKLTNKKIGGGGNPISGVERGGPTFFLIGSQWGIQDFDKGGPT